MHGTEWAKLELRINIVKEEFCKGEVESHLFYFLALSALERELSTMSQPTSTYVTCENSLKVGSDSELCQRVGCVVDNGRVGTD